MDGTRLPHRAFRMLWIVLIDAVMRDDNRLPIETCQNLKLGVSVMAETDRAEAGAPGKSDSDQSRHRGRALQQG
jgi:hypothetical protein